MDHKQEFFQYDTDGVSFSSVSAASLRELYLPLCGIDARGIKSAITPFLSGDIKVDKARYLTKPVSRQDLRNPLRNFFVRTSEGDIFSLLDREGDDAAYVTIGQLWQKLTNRSERLGLTLESLNFVPVSGEKIEIMRVTIRNDSGKDITLTPVGCIPVFGRSLLNKHDHEQVTSLLHRIQQCREGIIVAPTMAFNEEGHHEIHMQYFVFGAEENGGLPKGSFPTVPSFLGDSGTWDWPEAVVSGAEPMRMSPSDLNGKEAAGALCFEETMIPAGGEKTFVILIGVSENARDALHIYKHFNSGKKVSQAFEACRSFWMEKSRTIQVQTAEAAFDSWLRWVTLQPVLRRIFGCSFLPDHDYGKGDKGWRDLWQDQLSLILIEPQSVRSSLVGNFGGVRIDGTNATIIGSQDGEFIADRNAITRVWMDHGAWPVLTVLLYMDQTGDTDILFEERPYFRDPQFSRTRKKDSAWSPAYGSRLKTASGKDYQGSVLEHMLVQTLTSFFNVGEHNMIRLEGADWNDGLDMASQRGESVAFSAFYAGNLVRLADTIAYIREERGVRSVRVFKEMLALLDTVNGAECEYDNAEAKRRLLFEDYCSAVEPEISGDTVEMECGLLEQDLRRKAQWLFQKIKEQEKVVVKHQGEVYQWFNGYYDNQGRRVEGRKDNTIRMTLTGQVFAVMSGLADQDEIRAVIRSADAFLKDPVHGGHRLNTDFGVRNDLDLGRAFSFAYGTKENGAVFSHMAVMYAYALYAAGFVREGFEAIEALYRMSARFEVSKIYPNIPEYFDSAGQGMYGYLTGSASWMVLTVLTQAFGVRGKNGDLILEPKLVREQFSEDGRAAVRSVFAGREIQVVYKNPGLLDAGSYVIRAASMNGKDIDVQGTGSRTLRLTRSLIEKAKNPVEIVVELGKR